DGLRNGWLQRFRLENQTGTERLYLTIATGTASIQPVTAMPDIPKAVDLTSTNPASPMPASKTESEDKGRKRTAQMCCCLKQRRIYSPKTIRDYIFKALREATKQSTLIPLSASQLNRQVCSNAETQA